MAFKSISLFVGSAADLRNVETFGKLDPYVVVMVGKEELTGPVFDDAGVNPRMNLYYKMKYDGAKEITFIVKDKKSMARDAECGRGTINITPFLSRKVSTHKVELKYKDKKDSGHLNVSFQLRPEETKENSIIALQKIEGKKSKKEKDEPIKAGDMKHMRVTVGRVIGLRPGASNVDASAELIHEGYKLRSTVQNDAGPSPRIDSLFLVPFHGSRELKLKFFDDNYKKDKAVGSVTLDLKPFFAMESMLAGKRSDKIVMALKEQGLVNLRIRFGKTELDSPTVITEKTAKPLSPNGSSGSDSSDES